MSIFIKLNNLLGLFPAGVPAPDGMLAVIGDVHGRRDLLECLFDRLDQVAPQARSILVGDMIDRGPDSRGVLACVQARGAVAVRGNHEQMLLDFLDAPAATGSVWFRSGGIQTLESFGIMDPAPDIATRDALRCALSDGGEAWLRGLSDRWRGGNVVVVHAGADPRVPLAEQNPKHLLWGHPACGRFPRADGLWLVHGHTIVSKPRRRGRVVSVDTGAWQSGRLSAALISARGVRFLTVGG